MALYVHADHLDAAAQVALAQRRDDVLVRMSVGVLGGRGLVHEARVRSRLRPQVLDHREQRRHPRSRVEREVEVDVRGQHPGVVAAIATLHVAPMRGFDRLHVGISEPGERVARREGLQVDADRAQLEEGLHRQHRHRDRAPVHELEQALGDQAQQGFAHRRLARPQALAQRLQRERVARLQASDHQVALQLAVDPAGDAFGDRPLEYEVHGGSVRWRRVRLPTASRPS